MTTLAENIRFYREKIKLTQGAVARHLNMKPGSYGMYETGRAEPSLAKLVALRKLFGLTGVEGLLDQEAEQNPDDFRLKYERLPENVRKIIGGWLE